ncbi:MAG TPA: hypothetical protein VFF73_32920 [Planctomycetota bacterium]|nr:hypothetical protein [Planctomycetota bacterium]
MAPLESRHEVKVERPRCPFCHDDVQAEDEKHGCATCMAWHHLECWEESGARCATCGHAELEVLPNEPSEDELEVLPEPAAEYPAPGTSTGVVALANFYGAIVGMAILFVVIGLGHVLLAVPAGFVAYFLVAFVIWKLLR